MTKADIINKISKKTGIERPQTTIVVEAFMDVVREGMISGNNLYLSGFGTFLLKQRADKTARNISKGTTIVVPAHKIPAFKPSKEFAKQVKENKL